MLRKFKTPIYKGHSMGFRCLYENGYIHPKAVPYGTKEEPLRGPYNQLIVWDVNDFVKDKKEIEDQIMNQLDYEPNMRDVEALAKGVFRIMDIEGL